MTVPLAPTPADDGARKSERLEFADNALLIQLFGSHHAHLARIEQHLDVSLHAHGNEVNVAGPPDDVAAARAVLEGLYERLRRGLSVGSAEVEAAVRMAVRGGREEIAGTHIIRTRKRQITPRSGAQLAYVNAIESSDLVFGLGPAGTGKTYLAVAKAVEKLVGGEVDRIILSRPAVEAGEQLGFLPGDMREKVDPYLRPLYDALYDMFPSQQVAKRLESGEIEIAPLAFMRGRTLSNAFVILDEAQNTTPIQMKMFLTRLGENARMVVTGDLSQIDLPDGARSGLRDSVDVVRDLEGVAVITFSDQDVFRHSLVTRVVRAYERMERNANSAREK